MSLIGPVPKS